MDKKPLMRRVQQLHLWLGTLFAPMIIFFALTGALQTFSLHEKAGAPAWIARLAQIHKNQNLAVRERPPGPPPARNGASATPARREGETTRQAEGARESGPSPLPLKIFVLLMSVGLIVTTLLGLWMAFKYSRDKRVVWGLLAAGVLLPVVLLFL